MPLFSHLPSLSMKFSPFSIHSAVAVAFPLTFFLHLSLTFYLSLVHLFLSLRSCCTARVSSLPKDELSYGSSVPATPFSCTFVLPHSCSRAICSLSPAFLASKRPGHTPSMKNERKKGWMKPSRGVVAVQHFISFSSYPSFPPPLSSEFI